MTDLALHIINKCHFQKRLLWNEFLFLPKMYVKQTKPIMLACIVFFCSRITHRQFPRFPQFPSRKVQCSPQAGVIMRHPLQLSLSVLISESPLISRFLSIFHQIFIVQLSRSIKITLESQTMSLEAIRVLVWVNKSKFVAYASRKYAKNSGGYQLSDVTACS